VALNVETPLKSRWCRRAFSQCTVCSKKSHGSVGVSAPEIEVQLDVTTKYEAEPTTSSYMYLASGPIFRFPPCCRYGVLCTEYSVVIANSATARVKAAPMPR
jgi:hypothetical protein